MGDGEKILEAVSDDTKAIGSLNVGPALETEPGYGSSSCEGADTRRSRYTALDPAKETFACRCGKPSCFFVRLQPFREHIARLYRAIAICEVEGCLKCEGWHTVLYPLQMAASIEDVLADTAYVDDTQSVMFCSGAAQYEAAKSEVACGYVAALSVFTFLWAAYEGAARLTLPGELKRLNTEGRFGERGRRLLEEWPEHFPQLVGVQNMGRLADSFCERGNRFDSRLGRIRAKFTKKDLVYAAELSREFRNFIVHGEDEVPEDEDWHYGRAPGESAARVRRFYAVGRLLLLLIQAFTTAALCEPRTKIEWDLDEEFERIDSDPKQVLVCLHLKKLSENGNVM